jgi:DNA-binding GntR family transcriptional regulator
MAGKSALEQVSRLLLHDLAERNEPTLELTQEKFAAALGLSRQTISRAFHDLASEGAIETGRRSIRLLDLDKLRAHVPR